MQQYIYDIIDIIIILQYFQSQSNVIKHTVGPRLSELQLSGDCSIGVFCQQVYFLLEYFVTGVCCIRIIQHSSLYINQWASFTVSEHFCDSGGAEEFGYWRSCHITISIRALNFN